MRELGTMRKIVKRWVKLKESGKTKESWRKAEESGRKVGKSEKNRGKLEES
jgi:hypothetical protein